MGPKNEPLIEKDWRRKRRRSLRRSISRKRRHALERGLFFLSPLGLRLAFLREHPDSILTRHVLEYRRLPEELDGFTILHITDLHAGFFNHPDHLHRVVDIINGYGPDLVAITGDLIHYDPKYIEGCIEALDRLRARAGTYVVFGNHDHYTGCGALAQAIRQSKRLELLVDRKADSPRLPPSLHLIGLDDPLSHGGVNGSSAVLSDLLNQCPLEGFRLLLSHRPTIFRMAKHLHLHLTLSGHTHGGQMIVPVPGTRGFSLSRVALPFSHGWYHAPADPENRMYVNRGLGTVVVPFRINCSPEIAWIRLKRKRNKTVTGRPEETGSRRHHRRKSADNAGKTGTVSSFFQGGERSL